MIIMKRGCKIALLTVGAVLAVLIAVSVAAGPIARAYLVKHSEEICHRKVDIEHIRINIFNGGVSVLGFTMKEENPQQDFVSFSKLKVRLSLPRLLGKSVYFRKVELDGLYGHVIQNKNRFNFSDITDYFSENKKEDKDDKPSGWSVTLNNISICNSALTYQDVPVGSSIGIKNIVLNVPCVSFSGDDTQVDLNFDFEKEGQFAVKLAYNIEKEKYELNLKWSKFDIATLKPYLTQYLNVGTLKGKLDGDLKATGSTSHLLNLIVQGSLCLKNVEAVAENQSPLVSASSLQVVIDKIDLENKEYRIGNIKLDSPMFRYEIFKEGNTLSRLFFSPHTHKTEDGTAQVQDERQKQDTADVGQEKLHFVVKKLAVSNGQFLFADKSVSPREQEFAVGNIEVSAENISDEQNTTLVATAGLGSMGTLHCSGNVDIKDFKNADIEVMIENLALKDFSPYSLHYLASPLQDGLFTFRSTTVIKDSWLNSRNGIDIYKPVFGKKDRSLTPVTKVPVRAAVYILTDRKHHARIEVPVKGNVASPEFSFRKAFWKTLANLIVKIAASPIDFIGDALAGNGTFKAMVFPPRDTIMLNMEQMHQIQEIATCLKEKEELVLEIQTGVNIAAEDTVDLQQRENMLMSRCYETIKGQLAGQGIAGQRIQKNEERLNVSAKDELKAAFNLRYDE